MNIFYILGMALLFINSALFGMNAREGDVPWAIFNMAGAIISIFIIHTEFRKK